MAKELVEGIFPKEAQQDFIVTKLSFKVADFANFLRQKEGVIKENNGWINIDVLKCKSGKWYCAYNDWKPEKEVKAAQHSPDRITEDLPF